MVKLTRITLISIVAMMMVWNVATVCAAQPGAAQSSLAPEAKSVVLMDATSGTIIYERDANVKLPPASITKVMTMLLIVEAIDQGVIKYSDSVTVSDYAASMGGSQIFLDPGEQMSVEEMLKGIAMASGNDASVAMAEKIAGSEAEFVNMMNARAKELGLKHTHFQNSNGLPADNHYSSAHDIAIMSRELLKHEEITKYTGQYQDYLRKDSEEPFWLVNTNKLVRFYDGADGLKTGYTSEAKFCLTATAKREGLRLIAVVMGEPNTKTRNAEVSQLFDYAFAQYKSVTFARRGAVMGTVEVTGGEQKSMTITAKHDYSVLTKKTQTSKEPIRYEWVIDKPLKAPVRINAPIGKVRVLQGNTLLTEIEVDAPVTINKASWLTLLKRTMSSLF